MVLDPKSSHDWAASFANAKEAKNCHMVYPDGHGCLHEFLVVHCFGHFVKHVLLNLSIGKNQRSTEKHNRNHGVSRMEGLSFPRTEVIFLTRYLHEPADMWKSWKHWWKMARNDSHPHQLNSLFFMILLCDWRRWLMIYQYKNPAKPWDFLLVWREKVPWSLWSKEGTCAAMFALLHIMTPNLLKLAASCHRFGFFISHVCSRFLDKQLSWWTNMKTVKLMRTLSSLSNLIIPRCSSKPWTSFKEIDARFLRRFEISDRIVCIFVFFPYQFFPCFFFSCMHQDAKFQEKQKAEK